MASRARNREGASTSEQITEELDELSKRLERCKVLFEQYFLGIQRTPPSTLQIDLERRFRKMTQNNIRNTGLRFRFTTLSQKFASYNTYWKRTMRQIENGTYLRDIARVGRNAARTGAEIPEEILAKMPKRMRERVERDRDLAIKRQQLAEHRENKQAANDDPKKVRNAKAANVHQLDESDLLDDLDLESIFSQMMTSDEPKPEPKPKQASSKPEPAAATGAADSELDTMFEQIQTKTPVKPVAKPVARTAPPRAKAPPTRAQPKPYQEKPPTGMSADDADKLFKRYVKARKLVGEDTSKLTYNKLMRSLNKQAPRIIKEHSARGVSFDVVVRGEKVVIKAKPKK